MLVSSNIMLDNRIIFIDKVILYQSSKLHIAERMAGVKDVTDGQLNHATVKHIIQLIRHDDYSLVVM